MVECSDEDGGMMGVLRVERKKKKAISQEATNKQKNPKSTNQQGIFPEFEF